MNTTSLGFLGRSLTTVIRCCEIGHGPWLELVDPRSHDGILANLEATISVDALMVDAHGDLSHPEMIEQVGDNQSRGGRQRSLGPCAVAILRVLLIDAVGSNLSHRCMSCDEFDLHQPQQCRP